jgi:hypothetical protein
MKNQENHSDSQEPQIIDLEHHFNENRPHPIYDPGTVVLYRLKIDEEKHVSRTRHIHHDELFRLANKDSHDFEIFLVGRKDNCPHEEKIRKDIEIDLGDYGIERFITRPRVTIYHFFIGKKEYTTTEEKLTVNAILVDFAKVDPNSKTLAIKNEGGFHEYKNLDEILTIKDCPHYILFDNEPVCVS